MEQMMNQNTNMEMNMDTGAAKKQGKGMMFGMIACAILAVAGIGFGIYEMSQVKTTKQQIADLKIEVKKDDGSTTTIETDKIEVKETDKTVVITDSTKTREDGYFYFDEWGIKVKLPERFHITAYRVNSPFYGARNINQGSYWFWGGMPAENSDTLAANYPGDYPDHPLLIISRYDKELYESEIADPDSYTRAPAHATKIYEDDKYVYAVLLHLTSEYGIEINDNAKLAWNMASEWYNDKTAFFDPSNYSAI